MDIFVLLDEDVVIDVEYSMLNYKDVLVVIGKSLVVWIFLMVVGIDLVGMVLLSCLFWFKVGDKVLVNGWGFGE